ncbi:MAG: sulfatase [Planctomycetota bacterium]|jgi:arylsulfatase A-like enzyme
MKTRQIQKPTNAKSNVTLNRRSFIKAMGFGLASLTVPLSSAISATPQSKKPNIVFILADDLGWHQLGCYGSKYYKTPNLDLLAAQSMRFTDAYAAEPICSPTRASIMTGKYPARLHLTNYIAGDKRGRKLKAPDWTKYLPLSEKTIAEALRDLGYINGHFGKWHLNRDKKYSPDRPGDPGSQGFDDVLTSHKPGKGRRDPKDPHNVKLITDRAIRFMENNKDKPFFCYVTHNSVHRPDWERLELVAKYENRPYRWDPGNRPVMAAMVQVLDAGVGRVMKKIKQLGIAENTIVIFFSDNGMYGDYRTRKPLRGAKGHLYEAGIRVPMMVRWPGKVEPDSTCSVPVISNDFYLTLVEAAGGDTSGLSKDGVSLMPLLRQKSKIQRDALYFHYPHYSPQDGVPGGVVDLSGQMPEKTLELYGMHKKWQQEVGAQQMTKNPKYRASRNTGENLNLG